MSPKKIAVLQSNYIPWKGYFDLVNLVDEFIIYDDMQYTKNDWRNRNKIKTPQGLQWLTIPVKQEKLDQKIKETKVFDKTWNKKHWKSIRQNYSKAPFFKDYKEVFEELYLNCTTEFLSEINYSFITTINELIGITTKLSWSSDYEYGEGKTERLVKLVQLTGGTEYVSGPAARNYLDESLFQNAGIQVTWKNYKDYPEYLQLFPPFEHGVTILDLIFNTGPEVQRFMKTFSSIKHA